MNFKDLVGFCLVALLSTCLCEEAKKEKVKRLDLYRRCACAEDDNASPDDFRCCPCNCPCGTTRDLQDDCVCRRCSNPSPPPPDDDDDDDCFPSAATVNLDNGKTVTMSELEVGDFVATVTSSGGVAFSEVRGFMKRRDTVTTMYKSIRTSLDKTISLSGEHLIYAMKTTDNKFKPIYADEVTVDDDVLVHENGELIAAKVTAISDIELQGVFTPVTMNGKIVVDGVLASCYATVDHDLGHIAMAPMRWFPGMMGWIFGDDDGFSVYARIGQNLKSVILPEGLSY